ncbi:tumor necrosis factor receptor superfamily member 14-like isoform X2 [Brienomyrus brachyistius]|uniref:tumor necrosis factor receptor superfamily member 14-like isoform X2 n=1 Tax=Brienomyrus brachyistius TaxID=42636 RepID=UPI0020B3EF8B|nr:tumor necrosis factor receptor superfamily member 14-like isoform X2 [Brienomyrus brachyistius]
MAWMVTYIIYGTFVFLSLMVAGKKCGPAEYESHDGECCPMCGIGMIVLRDCTSDSSTTCRPCVDQTYMDEPNGLKRCSQCKICDSGQGLHVLRKCTTITNTVCDVLDGFYCVAYSGDNECSYASEHKSCLPGQEIKTPGSKTRDVECEGCSHGYYSTDGVHCTPWTSCNIDEEKIEDGTKQKDVVCQELTLRHRYLICFAFTLFLIALIGLFLLLYAKDNRRRLNVPVQESDRVDDSQNAIPEAK